MREEEGEKGGERGEGEAIGRRSFSFLTSLTLRICHTSTPLKCIVNLGDIIDGHEGEGAAEKDRRDLHDVLSALATIEIPKYPFNLSFPSFLSYCFFISFFLLQRYISRIRKSLCMESGM